MTRERIRAALCAIVAAMLLFWLGDKISWQIRTDLTAGMQWGDLADRFWLDLMNPLHLSLDRTDMLWGLGMVGVGCFAWMYHITSKLNTRAGEEHGSARWGNRADIMPFEAEMADANLHFTQTERIALDTRKTMRNLNVLLLGSSGSGKTRYYVKPNILCADMNFSCTDPKGELKRDTEEGMRARGYEVSTLDLIHLDQSDGFNPMRYLDPGEPEPAILRLVDNIVTNTTGNQKNSDDFWEKAEKALLTALIDWVYWTEEGESDGPNGRRIDNRSLNKVTDMVSLMNASEQDEDKEFIVDAYFAEAAIEVENAALNPDDYDAETRRMLDGLRFACTQYRTFLQGAGETKKSIIISLGVRLAPMQVSNVRRILETDGFDLDRLDEGKRIIYLELSDTDSTFSFLAAMFYQSLFETLVRKADINGGVLKREVHLMLDEFANIGKIPNFVRLIATIRSRRISTSIILQNDSQGKALYKDDWETIKGNCDSQLFLGGNEQSTTEYISKRLGNETIDVIETSESRGSSGSWTKSVRKNERALLNPDELGRIPTDMCVYMLRGVPPFYSRKLHPDPNRLAGKH
ncbi:MULTISPECIES: VirD4-like conjugal transfer protein, CD1115 family [Bifidobacterium]|uniref:Conjugal transfer protein TraG n=2 Tax=Bifidobacterium TaxID=1678 RepID=A0A261FTH9_9BIFI|nr:MULTISPECIES: type IV secretory system conjugative DNA transfer family protein [Bifidobacterium]OZG62482.1 conjugal transfer protein TraG [Bifidobacterium lemurum]OZG69018.1 conjugal transfer protein TraG [Bifidobacterium eulemuris]QOL31453.1 type IV secretory system conjugative DNA transfer family protein [Bifidobacterium eulemuris]QOL33824.1 type IV secretory system conjugative DNA transfer family protein [Bifidobacterium lemurum]